MVLQVWKGTIIAMSGKEWKTDDAPLVRKILKGDSDAWGLLVDRYNGYVFHILRSSRVPEADQPDAFQYVFVELFRALPKMQSTDYLAPWIRQTAVRHAVRLRTRAERIAPLPEEEISHLPDFDGDLEAAELGIVVRESIQQLKEQCRKLIQMLFFEEPVRPYKEVSEELGISMGSIGNTRLRCLEALKQALKKRGVV